MAVKPTLVKLTSADDRYHNDYRMFDDVDQIIYGYGGHDVIYAGHGKDAVYGGDGNDTIYGGISYRWSQTDAGGNVLSGGNGNDRICASEGDTVSGGNGADVISLIFTDTAGVSSKLSGGAGRDVFSFSGEYFSDVSRGIVHRGSDGGAHIMDFQAGDKVDLRSFDLRARDLLIKAQGNDTLIQFTKLYDNPVGYADSASTIKVLIHDYDAVISDIIL